MSLKKSHVQDEEGPQRDTKRGPRLRAGSGSEVSCCFISLAVSFRTTLVLLSLRHPPGSFRVRLTAMWQMDEWIIDLMTDTEETEGTQTCLAIRHPPPTTTTHSPAGIFSAHLLYFSFFTLYKFTDFPPAEGRKALFSLRGSSNGPLPVCVIERAVPLPVWGK